MSEISTPDTLLEQLRQSGYDTGTRPPVESWHPTRQFELDLHIDGQARWFYQGRLMTRERLVRLFASILIWRDGEYWLVTPVEQARITVEDAPFLVIGAELSEEEGCQPGRPSRHPVVRNLILTTNLGDRIYPDRRRPLRGYRGTPESGSEESVRTGWYVDMDRGLSARLSRPVYYQLADYVRQTEAGYVLQANDCEFRLG